MKSFSIDQRNAMRAEFQTFIAQVAKELGGAVIPDANGNMREGYATIELATVGLADVRLNVSLSTYGADAGKVVFGLPTLSWDDENGSRAYVRAGDVTRYGELSGLKTSAGFSMARGFYSVAKGLRSRFLPDARRLWAAMLERQREALAWRDETATTLLAVSKAAGRDPRQNDRNAVYLRSGMARVSGSGVQFERVLVTLEKALRIIAIIQEGSDNE
jgi:hypothetical protein